MDHAAPILPPTAPAKVILHIDPRYHDRYHKAAHLAIFPLIEDIITRAGGQVIIEPRPPLTLPRDMRWGDGDLHIVQGGMARGVGYLNAGLAYLTGYWHLDAQGVLADSSALGHTFDPAQMDANAASAFLTDLRARFVAPRASRYRQAKDRADDLPQGCIAVFLQGPGVATRQQTYLGQKDMLRAVVQGAQGRQVMVKAHPLRREHGAALMADLRAEGLAFTEAHPNVHDLLAVCAVTVSINSAVAIEGFLHGKPAILFGRSDFAGQVETVRRAQDFPAALNSALTLPRDYAPWLHWYFTQVCIDITKCDASARILAVFDEAGFDTVSLGLGRA
jgi:hypothetical protein